MTREALQIGTEIDRYLLKQVLSEDGQGISYLAVDTASVSGSAKVLVREYFPRGISVREAAQIESRDRQEARLEFSMGLAAFVGAAKSLIELKTHALVPALDIIQENSTAYLVLEWPDGRVFSEMVSAEGTMSADLLRSQLAILLPGLEELHGAGLLHAGISPETLIRLDDGYPAISRLTHVERYNGADVSRTHLLVDTPYAAPELNSLSDSELGPWTDIYSLAAACWFLLSGTAPPSATVRHAAIAVGRSDPLQIGDVSDLGASHIALAEVLLSGMALAPEKRIASAGGFLSALSKRRHSLSNYLAKPAALLSSPRGMTATAALAVSAAAVLSIGLGTKTEETASEPVLAAQTEVSTSAVLETDVAETELAETRLSDAKIQWSFLNQEDPAIVRSFLTEYAVDEDVSAEASKQLESLDNTAWATADTENTPQAMEVYLADFSGEISPPGLHAEHAKARLIALAGEHQFRVSEARRMLFAIGYKTNSRRGETPGLKRAILGFQESIDVETTGEITEELLDQIEAEIKRREKDEVKALAEAKKLAEQAALADQRFVELVRVAANSETRTAQGVINRPARADENAGKEPTRTIVPPKAEPRIIYETKIASSKITSGEITTAIIPPKPIPTEPVRSAGESFRDCKTCPELVVVPAGSFQMGSAGNERDRNADEGPAHAVSISNSFAMGKFEVSLGQYNAFVRATKRPVPVGCAAESDAKDGNWIVEGNYNFRSPGFSQTPVHPVTCVSWKDAKAYTNWLSKTTGKTYRLASESEWEYAARANTNSARHFGKSYREGCKFANSADRTAHQKREHWVTAKCRDGFAETSPIGSFGGNAFGLHDMLGNVWEWTEDCFAGNYSNTPRTEAAHKTSTCRSRVTRGGSWASGVASIRSAARSADAPTARYDMLGFRVVRELPAN